MGAAYTYLGNYAKAIDYGQQSLAIAREIKDREGEGNALVTLGNAYESLGNSAKAIEYSLQSLAIAREIKDREGEGNALALWEMLTNLWATRPKPLSISNNS